MGFEPTIRLRVCRISSAVPSTTQPPLQVIDMTYDSFGSAQCSIYVDCYRNCYRIVVI